MVANLGSNAFGANFLANRPGGGGQGAGRVSNRNEAGIGIGERAAERAQDRAERAAERAEERAERAAERAERQAERAAERAERQAERAAERGNGGAGGGLDLGLDGLGESISRMTNAIIDDAFAQAGIGGRKQAAPAPAPQPVVQPAPVAPPPVLAAPPQQPIVAPPVQQTPFQLPPQLPPVQPPPLGINPLALAGGNPFLANNVAIFGAPGQQLAPPTTGQNTGIGLGGQIIGGPTVGAFNIPGLSPTGLLA